MRNVKFVAFAVLAAVSTSACATKGYVNRTVTQERIARVSADSMQAADLAGLHGNVNGLRTDVNGLRTDLNALRTDLTSLRTDFNTRITAMENMVKFDMPVHFGFDQSSVRDEDRAALQKFAQVAQKYYPGAKITVEGFADPAGSARYNLALSKRRADAVRDFLVQQGLNDTLLGSVGYGEARPVRPGAAKNAAGAELNRRVTFVVEASDVGTVTAMAAPGQ